MFLGHLVTNKSKNITEILPKIIPKIVKSLTLLLKKGGCTICFQQKLPKYL